MKITAFLLLSIIIINVSCKKGTLTEDSSIIELSQLQKKWNLPSSNNLNYYWIEFVPGNTYIILQNDGESKSGKYSVAADGKTVTLSGLGTLIISNLNSNSFGFSLRSYNSTNSISTNGVAGAQTVSSTNTDLICQNWNIYKSYDVADNGYDTTYYPQTYQNSEGMIKGEAIFSHYGTYFVTRIDKTLTGVDTFYFNGIWNWNNPSETLISYVESTNPSDTGSLSIQQLTATNLQMEEDSSIYFFSH